MQGDHANTFPGGLGQEVLGDKLEIQTFTDMKHGWTVRGGDISLLLIITLCLEFLMYKHSILISDMSDPAVSRDVKKAIQDTLAFFKKYL